MKLLRVPLVILFGLALAAAACSSDTSVTVSADTNDDVATDDAAADGGADAEEAPPEEPVETPEEEPEEEPEPTEEPEGESGGESDDDAASLFAASLDDSDGFDQLDDATSLCVGIEVVGRFGGAKVIEMADDDYVPTADEVTGMVDALFNCTSEGEVGDAFAASIVDGFGSDLPEEDLQCVSDLYGSRDTIEEIMQLAVANEDLDFEELAPADRERVIGPFLECVGFGSIIRAALAEDGVTISDDTVACLNDAGSAFVEVILTAGDFDETPDEIQGDLLDAMFGCLSAEELGDLAG